MGNRKAENDNIGLGLSCSKIISNKVGGDSCLKQSRKGFTVFAFKIPAYVKKTKYSMDETVNTMDCLFGGIRPMNQSFLQYLANKNI